jgi:type II secretory ATPase GspE/PulE/Tfp pilus assembly ATPase PilB-like protein
MKGSGCPACANTGFQGVTGIFEVLPFAEQVRTPIARAATTEEISEAARAAGMRPMLSSGVARVAEGRVSPEELDRVLRFAQ